MADVVGWPESIGEENFNCMQCVVQTPHNFLVRFRGTRGEDIRLNDIWIEMVDSGPSHFEIVWVDNKGIEETRPNATIHQLPMGTDTWLDFTLSVSSHDLKLPIRAICTAGTAGQSRTAIIKVSYFYRASGSDPWPSSPTIVTLPTEFATGPENLILTVDVTAANIPCLQITLGGYFSEAIMGACDQSLAAIRRTYSFRNIGVGTLSIQPIDPAGPFSVESTEYPLPYGLVSNATMSVVVVFDPGRAGHFSESLVINHDGSGDSSIVCNGDARDATRDVSYSTQLVDFGEYKCTCVEYLSTHWYCRPAFLRTVEIINSGEAPLTVESVVVENPQGSHGHEFGLRGTFTGEIPCGESKSIEVSMPGLPPPYGHLAFADHEGTLVIHTDANVTDDEIQLRGTVSEGRYVRINRMIPFYALIIILFIIWGWIVLIPIPLP
ncbi:MAG: hypothetical protein RTV31_16940 [Candidatus Thorarchaeota archaeon]